MARWGHREEKRRLEHANNIRIYILYTFILYLLDFIHPQQRSMAGDREVREAKLRFKGARYSFISFEERDMSKESSSFFLLITLDNNNNITTIHAFCR